MRVLFDRYENVTRIVGPVSTLVVGVIAIIYLWRVVTFKQVST